MVILNFVGLLNSSVQIGDTAYYVNYSDQTYSDENQLNNVNTSSPIVIGVVESITTYSTSIPPTYTIKVQESGPIVPPTAITDFIFFSKENKVNTGKLTGYYGKVEFKNNSTTKAELFATACEISESSK